MQVCLEQHAMVHAAAMSQINAVTIEDELWADLGENTFRLMPTRQDETIAWSLWHITRIEDITMNILVAGGRQVLNTEPWLEKLQISVCDTGNAMTDGEMIAFSNQIDMQELRKYRIAVGRKTRQIIQGLQPADLKRKMAPDRLRRVFNEGAVLDVEDANWLVDFWGRKNVAGILLMPVTRHLLVHLNEALRLKGKCRSCQPV